MKKMIRNGITLSFLLLNFLPSNIIALALATPNSSSVVVSPKVSKKIAVAGATGRTGSFVVRELLDRGDSVVALVRDLKSAEEKLFASEDDKGKIEVRECNLVSEKSVISAVEGCDAAIWCATGFSNAPTDSVIKKIQALFGVVQPKKSIDIAGISALSKAFGETGTEREGFPKVVMMSSAGVTRPKWSDDKKAKFSGCADIPIVRLNPFGILDIKADSEEKLRQSGVSYSIFRPAGLNDDHPAGCRPIFSQGDVAVGRINRKDCAKILVDCLDEQESVGKTFEVVTLVGHQPSSSIKTSLSRMNRDSEVVPEESLITTYNMMQQLLPGEKQDAAALAMGQTYEQLDKDETGRLGKRGEENVETAPLKPS